MADEPDSVSFRVSTENLDRAIRMLRALGGLNLYPVAHQVLVLERSKRRLQAPPAEILLTRRISEELPQEVKHCLMEEAG
jgi:hypothetical protein